MVRRGFKPTANSSSRGVGSGEWGVKKARGTKRVYHLQSPNDVEEFYQTVEVELAK